MARMIPDSGPNFQTGSWYAEPDIYWRLKKQLSDDFTVIHSVPWLCEKAKEFDNRPVPIGEVDFLILHRDLGLLALEVKGGRVAYQRSGFVYLHNNQSTNPVHQVKRGIFGISGWLKDQGISYVKIGFALVFPDSELKDKPIPPAINKKLILDIKDLSSFGERIREIMLFWQKENETKPLGDKKIRELVDLICPEADYTPDWETRIEFDNKKWLKLTNEQIEFKDKLFEKNRGIITGWSGTGKTLLGISLARQLSGLGKNVLFLVYNSPLAEHLKEQLKDAVNCKIFTFHQLCIQAALKTGKQIPKTKYDEIENSWYKEGVLNHLRAAIEKGKVGAYDSLIIDEAQVFDKEWLLTLADWFKDKKISIFCDETQVFEFESSTSLNEITDIIKADEPYVLTCNHRSPRAVSDRLKKVKTTSYQLYNQREFEKDTLIELIVINPENELYKTLTELKNAGVDPKDITLLYKRVVPPNFRNLEKFQYRTETITRFRGLESPIIIIYAPKGTKENQLFSAYSRATTRCIVIYDAYETTKRSYGVFGEILLDLKDYSQIEQMASSVYLVNELKKLELSRQSVVSETVNIDWCFNWGCWLIIEQDGKEAEGSLWLDYLLDSTTEYLLYVNAKTRDTFHLYKPILKELEESDLSENNNIELVNSVELIFCNECMGLTPHISKMYGEICCLCELLLPKSTRYVPLTEIKKLQEYEKILISPRGKMVTEKQNLPVSLLGVGFWNSLNHAQKEKFSKTVRRAGGSFVYRAVVALTGVHILNAKKNSLIEYDDLTKKYHDLYKDLSKLTFNELKRNVSSALEIWAKRELIQKLRKGVFETKS